MGASYANTSIYLDGILVPSPFHGADISQGATLSMFTSETIEDVKLLPAAYPENMAMPWEPLSISTRAMAAAWRPVSVPPSDLPIRNSSGKGNWAARSGVRGWRPHARAISAICSRNRLNDTSDDISFYDADLKLTYDLTPKQNVNFYGVGGHTFSAR